MTANWCVYALGGGVGHATRGRNIQNALQLLGIRADLLISPHTAPFSETLNLSTKNTKFVSDTEVLNTLKPYFGGKIIVDTFPSGWHLELSKSVLSKFTEKILIARYHKKVNRPLTRFNKILIPYHRNFDEWRNPIKKGIYVGLILKEKKVRLEYSQNREVVILDPGRRISESFLVTVKRVLDKSNFKLKIYHIFPSIIKCQKILCIGSGYNTFYETISQEADIRFLPIYKNFDDQHRRARMHHRSIENPVEFENWIRSESLPSPICTQHSDFHANLRKAIQ